MTKRKLTGKSLYDLVTTKSKKFLDKMLSPIEKDKMKRLFANKVSDMVATIYESKAREISLLMNVKNVNLDSIIDENKLRREVFSDMEDAVAVYENIFGEVLSTDITKDELTVKAADILSQVAEIDEEDED